MAPTILADKKRQIRGRFRKNAQPVTAAPASALFSYVTKGNLSTRSAVTYRPRHSSAFHSVRRIQYNYIKDKKSIETDVLGLSQHIQQDDLVTITNSQKIKSTFLLHNNANKTSSTSSSSMFQQEYTENTDCSSNTDTVNGINHKSIENIKDNNISDEQLKDICRQSNNTCNAKTYSKLCEIQNTEGLLAIAIKTIKLVKRNQLLQQRLVELQLETSEFIQSVMSNPENRHFRDKLHRAASK